MNSMTDNTFKKNSLALLIATVLSTGSYSYAAEEVEAPEAEQEEGIPTITVTARRIEEDIQKVPVSVTALTADMISDAGISDIADIQFYTPNTTLQVSRATNSTLTAYIRGVGQQDPLWGFEPGVGLYVDDVYIARPQGAVLDILDIERVEILRGPQGTLYGKNTIGGAVKYVTKKMSGDTEFSLQGTVGSFSQRDIKIAGQLPIAEDSLYVGFAYANLNRDGFGNFINTGEENYNKELSAGRVSIEFKPNSDLFFRLAYDTTTDDSNARGGYRMTPSLVVPGQTPYASVFDSDTSLPVYNKVETSGTSFTANYNINDDLAIKYVWSDRDGYTRTNIDFDATMLNTFDVPAVYEDTQTTNELQLSYSADDWQAVMGYYSYEGDACGAFDVILGLFGITLENGGCVTTDSQAIYGQASFSLSDQWSMTVGGRYTKDEKTADVYRYIFLGSVIPEDDVPPLIVQSDFDGNKDWSEFSPRIGIEYQADDNIMYYASFAKGFKSGGFDMRANESANPLANEPFGPETVGTYEFGIKSDWMDGTFRLNGALFFSDYQDMQVTVQRAVGQNDFASQVVNAGEAEIKGFEIESTAYINDAFNLFFSMGYIDAEFVKVDFFDPTLGEVIDVSNTWVISNTPEWSANIGANYNIETSMGDLVATGNWAYRSESNIFEIPSALDMGNYSILNLSLNWYHSEGHWYAGLHIKNALDKEYRLAGYNFAATFDGQGNLVAPGLGGEDTVTGFYGDPRTIALTVGYKF